MKAVIKPVLYVLLGVLSLIMFITITQYASLRTDVGFLKFKQDYLGNDVWKVAFYTHVFSCFFCLLAGFTQFSNSVLKEHKALHRLMGKFYVINILIINVPAGFIMAIYANGHLPSKIAFCILDTLWFWFTLKAFLLIKKKDVKRHKEFMIRSFALTLSALTLRLWKPVFVNFTSLDVSTIYMIDAWMGFVPNLLIAEFLIIRKKKKVIVP